MEKRHSSIAEWFEKDDSFSASYMQNQLFKDNYSGPTHNSMSQSKWIANARVHGSESVDLTLKIQG